MSLEERRVAIVRTTFLVLLFLLFAYAFVTAQSFRSMSQPMPLFVTGAGLLFSTAAIAREIARWRKAGRGDSKGINISTTGDAEDAFSSASLSKAGIYWGWVGGFIAASAVVGFRIGTLIFVAAFLVKADGKKWPIAALIGALPVALLYALEILYGIQLPQPIWM